MARFMRLEVIDTLLDTGLVPLFYNADVETSVELASACARGGAKVIEFTNRGELANLRILVAECRQKRGPRRTKPAASQKPRREPGHAFVAGAHRGHQVGNHLLRRDSPMNDHRDVPRQTVTVRRTTRRPRIERR